MNLEKLYVLKKLDTLLSPSLSGLRKDQVVEKPDPPHPTKGKLVDIKVL